MSEQTRLKETHDSQHFIIITRWLLVPVAAVFGIIAAILPSFIVYRIIDAAFSPDGHPMPGKDWVSYYTLAVSGALAAFFFVFFGTRAAPKHHLAVSHVLLLIGSVVAWMLLEDFTMPLSLEGVPEQIIWEPIVGTYSGGLIACLAVCFQARLRWLFRFRSFR